MADEPEFVFPDGFPEEAKAEIIEEHKRAIMAQDADAHQLLGFLTSLSFDDLKVLRAILRACQSGPAVAGYYEGILSIMLAQKSGRCWACDKDHDADLAGIVADRHVEHQHDEPEPEHQTLTDQPDGSVKVESFDPHAVQAQATEYRVEFIGPVGPQCPVRCLGCGLKYVSLADRMMKRPDDCHGCHHKAAHG